MDKKKQKPFLEIPALKVEQPLGSFYVIKIPAKELLTLSFSEPMEYIDEFGNVRGSQRPKDVKRLRDIAKYIDSVEMAFPNSIILAANYTQTGAISKDDDERWRIIEDLNCGIQKLIIPKQIKLAAVIDGQHRLNAFEYLTNAERFNLDLVCSIYFDLPNSYQAFLFATINSNQKRVDRSLALEQFGFNVDDEVEKAWTPEKLAVFLSRKLNIDSSNSPFLQRIKVAPLHPENLFKNGVETSWVISTATIVDGIVSLISSNAKRDRIEMQQKSILTGRSRDMLSKVADYSPLRKLFIEGKDQTIYDTVVNYFKSADNLLWKNAIPESYIIRTVGIQALFDILKSILSTEKKANPEKIDFDNHLLKVSQVDFSDKFFQASGIGRSRIRNTIGIGMGLIKKERVKKSDLPIYEELLARRVSKGEKFIWEEEAEKAVINTLERTEWNYRSKSVSLYLYGDYEKARTFSDYDSFFSKLIEIAEENFVTNLPDDKEFAEEQREKFDAEDLVESNLADYESNLKRIGWIQNQKQ